MDNIDNEYISKAIDELILFFGVKERIPADTVLNPLRSGNIKQCVECVANYLGLPIAINLSYVSSKYRPEQGSEKFESSKLARTDDTGRGKEGITAQVLIPSYLPVYGSSELQGFPISVKITDNCTRYPSTFVTLISHELSHILLHSLSHKEKDNEVYTDLTAMVLGFSKFYEGGRKVVETKRHYNSVETLTTTYGYLSDEQFDFAYHRIAEILIDKAYLKEKLLNRLSIYGRQVSLYKAEFSRAKEFVEYLDKHQDKKIKRQDITRIMLLHQPNYYDECVAVIRRNERKYKEIHSFCVGLTHYTQQAVDTLRRFSGEIDTLLAGLEKNLGLFRNDVDILRKYLGLPYKIRSGLQAILHRKN